MLKSRASSFIFTTSLSLTLVGCGAAKRDEVADDIERAVANKPGIFELGRYSQYYFARPDGLILASFVIHIPNSEVARLHVKNACRSDEKIDFPCSEDDYGIVEPGHRKWLEREIDLPAMRGGGCVNITLTYNPDTDTVSQPKCNGPL